METSDVVYVRRSWRTPNEGHRVLGESLMAMKKATRKKGGRKGARKAAKKGARKGRRKAKRA